MRVDSNYLQSLVSSISSATSTEQGLSNELSTGLRINAVSDDPTAVAQGIQIGSAIAAASTFVQSASTVQSRMQAADGVLSEVVTQATSALSIATQAANGTQNATAHASAANQLTSIRDEILSLANTAYSGEYLFSGSQTGTQPFTLDTTTSPATLTYQGDAVSTSLTTSSGQSIATNLPGAAVFTGILGTLNTLITDVQSGDSTTIAADVSTLTASLGTVSTQRSVLDSNLSRINSASTYAQNTMTQQTATQSTLLSADISSVATQLSAVKTQQQALMDTVSALQQQGSLFDYLNQ